VVEDDASVGQLVQRLFEQHGYRVQVVSTGADAVELWQQGRDTFDLVLTDVIMPGGISGRDLAERLRTSKPDLKVIYMSGYTGEVVGRGLDLREGVNFLQKPFGPTPLLACVRSCLDGRD
jgi:two-component system, cell cycle sensor histidine kinase and response regulator CckA